MHLQFQLEKDTRLDLAIHIAYPDIFSRAHAQKLIHAGFVFVDEQKVEKSSFKSGHPCTVSIDYEPEPEFNLIPNKDFHIPVLFQDKYLAIIHKPAGMTVHPGAGTGNDTLVHVLKSQIQTLSDGNDSTRPGIVHRLDRDTEGIMVIAKTNHIHYELAQLFYDRKVEKEYFAIVWGNLPESGSINGFIGRHPVNRKKMLFDFIKLNETYKESFLDYTKLKETDLFSLVKINLYTGRTHQIRASFSKMEHPVLGDEIYSRYQRRLDKSQLSGEIQKKIISGGLYLAATRLSFYHPVTKEKMDYTIPLPERFSTVLSI